MDDVDMSDDASAALQQDLSCPVCKSIFQDPMLLPCTHSLCRECLQRSWQFNKKCPVCRNEFTEDQAVANRVLKNTCETFVKQTNWKFLQKPSEFSCNLHFKPLELYCEKDEEPVCVDCATLHSTHRLLSLKDGVPLCKVQVPQMLQNIELLRSLSLNTLILPTERRKLNLGILIEFLLHHLLNKKSII